MWRQVASEKRKRLLPAPHLSGLDKKGAAGRQESWQAESGSYIGSNLATHRVLTSSQFVYMKKRDKTLDKFLLSLKYMLKVQVLFWPKPKHLHNMAIHI